MSSEWTSCDNPPDSDRGVLLTTCKSGNEGHRNVHKAYFHISWWHHLGARIQDIPVSWRDMPKTDADYVTKPNPEARIAELDASIAAITNAKETKKETSN